MKQKWLQTIIYKLIFLVWNYKGAHSSEPSSDFQKDYQYLREL